MLRAMIGQGERGASVLEAALVLPFLLLLVAGIVDFGGAFNDYIIITNAAREGARYGARFPYDGGGIRAAVIQEAAGVGVTITAGNVTIDPDPGAAPAAGGAPITVTVTLPYTPLMGTLLGTETIALNSSTTMIVYGLDN
jgi:Flp pilus assembly protein TadG